MRKLTLSLISLLSLNSMLIAGGDVVEIVEAEATEVITSESGFYLGLGVSRMALNNDYSGEEFSVTGLMLQAGYQYNRYLALEGRYSFDISDVQYDHGNVLQADIDNYPGNFSNLAAYVKGMYPIGDFRPYLLIGYGEVALTNIPLGGPGISADRAESGFQWGLGADYKFTESVSVFIDYLRAYDGNGFDGRAVDVDVSSDMWTLGVSYRF